MADLCPVFQGNLALFIIMTEGRRMSMSDDGINLFFITWCLSGNKLPDGFTSLYLPVLFWRFFSSCDITLPVCLWLSAPPSLVSPVPFKPFLVEGSPCVPYFLLFSVCPCSCSLLLYSWIFVCTPLDTFCLFWTDFWFWPSTAFDLWVCLYLIKLWI